MKRESIIEIIVESIKLLDLDLCGLTVFTEAGSGHYLYTPLISALAGAERTYAMIKDSRYGKKEDIADHLRRKMAELSIDDNKVFILHEKEPPAINRSDIITNLGFVRPINKGFIDCMKKRSVISLMCEAWEYRKEDVDIDYANDKGIPVVAVNEEDDRIRIMDYVGLLAEKKAGEIAPGARVALFGSDKFTKKIEERTGWDVFGVDMFDRLISEIERYDVIVLSHHSVDNSPFFDTHNLEKVKDKTFIQIAGGLIDFQHAIKEGISVFPERDVKPGYMGWTLAELGPKPVIHLHTAGLKVGERFKEFIEGRTEEINNILKDCKLCQKTR